MAIRETIVFELDATPLAQGAQRAATAVQSLGTAAATAQAQLTSIERASASTTAAAVEQARAVGAIGTAYQQVERASSTAAASMQRATRGLGDVARASGEPVARLVGIFAGPEIGAGVARLFAVEKGIAAAGQVAEAAGTGLGKFFGPLAIGLVAVEGVTFAVSALSRAFEVQRTQASEAAKATEDFVAAAELRLRSLSGSDRDTALAQVIERARASIADLGKVPAQNFSDLDELRSRLGALDEQARRLAPLLADIAKAEPGSRVAFVGREFTERAADIDRQRQNITNQRAVVGGQEFVPSAGLRAISSGIPELSESIARAEAEAVPGLIRLADALRIFDEASAKAATPERRSALRETLDGLSSETSAVLERRLAIEEAITQGASLEAAIIAGNRVQAEAAALAQLGADATEAQAEAVRRAAAAYFDAEQGLTAYLDKQRQAEAAAKSAREEAERAREALVRDAQSRARERAREGELLERQRRDREAQEAGRTAGALAGGVGDFARAARDGEDPFRAALTGISDRMFELSIQRLEQSLSETLAPLFGGTALQVTPGEQLIVQAIDRNTAAVGAAGGKGGGVGGATSAAAPGFNWGGLALGAIGLGLGFLGRRSSRGSSNDDGSPGLNVVNRGGGITNANRIIVNNYSSGPGRIRETRKQMQRDVRSWMR